MNIAKYCKSKNMSREEYKTFKSNIEATVQAIKSNLKYNGGMYYKTSDLLKWDIKSDINCMLINELKKLDIEFFSNDTLYRVC